jgi:hypothetical protein
LGVVRDGDGLPNPALAGGGVTLDSRSGPWTFTVGDLWVVVRSPASRASLDIDVPLVALAYGASFGGFAVSDRNRFEQLDGAPGEPWRYRNRLQVDHPVTGLGPVASVFASDEVFYEFSQDRWVRNRAQVGVAFSLRHREQIQVYYLRQDDRDARPGALNVLGLAYKVVLR